MTALTLINHLLNFAAPALTLALLLVMAGHLFIGKATAPRGWIAPIAIVSIVCCVVLALGGWWLGSDGQMLTYMTMVLMAASAYWLWLRGWR